MPLLALLFVILPLSAGCTRHAPAPIHAQRSFLPTQSSLASSALYPSLFSEQPQPMRFRDAGGRVMVEQPLRLDQTTAAVRLNRSIQADPEAITEPQPHSCRTIETRSDGGVALRSSSNTERDVTLRFQPPLPIAPAVLRSGAPFESETGVEEIDPETGQKQRAGSARYRLEVIGESAEAGSVELLVRSTLEIRLGQSTVLRTTDRLYREQPSGGYRLSGESTVQVVRAIGLTVSRAADAWIVETD